ncbi:MAG: LysM peptidoglycan-binding domain-containing protein [Phycisphaerae bacterium]
MTRETRIGLLVGLVFIFAFGLILGELTNGDGEPPVTTGSLRDVDYLTHEADRGAIADPRYTRPRRRTPAVGRRTSAERGAQRPGAQRSGGSDRRAVSPPPARKPVDPRKTTRRYRTREGDTLTRIARLAYGQSNGHLYEIIYRANKDTLPNRDVVPVGVVLKIPPMP